MIRRVLSTVLALSLAAPLMAQAPKGWKLRVDRSTSATDPDAAGDIKFMAMGGGFHAVNPQAAVYWNPANTASGNYTLKGSFKLLKPSNHTNYYGLVFGGADLEGPNQAYSYFLVAQDGSWILKTRNGDALVRGSNPADVAPKTMNAAVAKPGADGTSVNNLEVRVQGDKVDYVVNGTVVHTTPKSAVRTDGIYGFRVNHFLEVMVEGFGKA
jgi:hypothetical protein